MTMTNVVDNITNPTTKGRGRTVLDWPDYFGEMGATYDQRAFSGSAMSALASRELAIVTDRIGPGPGSVLDIGAGTGRFTTALLDAGWKVTSFDGSARMLAVIGERAPAAELVEGRLGEPLPFATAAFDALVAMRVVKYVADTGAALRQMARVVAPGGRLVFDVANRRSLARFGYGGSAMGMVTSRSLRVMASAAGLAIEEIHDGPRLPHPVLVRAGTPRSAALAAGVERNLSRVLGCEVGSRSLIVVAARVSDGGT